MILMYSGFCVDLSKFQWKLSEWLETFFGHFTFFSYFYIQDWIKKKQTNLKQKIPTNQQNPQLNFASRN